MLPTKAARNVPTVLDHRGRKKANSIYELTRPRVVCRKTLGGGAEGPRT